MAEDDSGAGRRRVSMTMLTAVVALLTGVLALAAGAVGLLFDLRPDLRLEPRERQFATLSVVAVERGVPLRGYLERSERMALYRARNGDEKGRCRLQRPGTFLYLEIGIEGFKGRETYLRYATYDAGTRRRLPEPSGREATITGEVTSERGVSIRWVRTPPRPGKYFVRWELYLAKEDADLLLAFTDTPPLVVDAELMRRTDAVAACVAAADA